jgi:hypothetical protein
MNMLDANVLLSPATQPSKTYLHPESLIPALRRMRTIENNSFQSNARIAIGNPLPHRQPMMTVNNPVFPIIVAPHYRWSALPLPPLDRDGARFGFSGRGVGSFSPNVMWAKVFKTRMADQDRQGDFASEGLFGLFLLATALRLFYRPQEVPGRYVVHLRRRWRCQGLPHGFLLAGPRC